MALSPKNKLAAAIMRVVGADPSSASPSKRGLAPYFGSILRGLVRREMDEKTRAAYSAIGLTPTIGVSKDGVLVWDVEFVDSFADDRLHELALILLHEAMHVAVKSFERAEALGIVPEPTADAAARASLWNLASDMSINEEVEKIVKLAGGALTMPKDACLPKHFNQPSNLIAEERYHRLLKDAQAHASKSVQPKPGGGWCGGCAGHKHPGEPEGDSPDGRSEAAMGRMRRETAEAVRDMAAKHKGSVPDSLVRWSDTMLAPPKIPWREKLARLVRGAVAFKAGHSDLTWQRPSRRQAGLGYGVGRAVMPAFHAPVPRVSVLVDTSGSMSEEALATVAAELQGVLAATGADVTVAAVDAALQGIKECRTIADAVALFKGGGGTVLIHGWNALLERKPTPDVIIVCTDGYIGGGGDGYPADEPKAKVIWVVVEGRDTRPCPYGDVVYIGPNDVKEEAA